MANMLTCPCGWTVISPQGVDDVRKHIAIHLRDVHPGTNMTDAEIQHIIRTV